MKTLEVEDFVYDEFQNVKKSLGTYGTRPPGVPFGYDDTATLQNLLARARAYSEIRDITRRF